MAETPEVNLHFSDYWRVVKNRWPIILTIFVLVVTTAYFYTKTLPKIYTSSSVIKVDMENKDMSVFGASMQGFDAIFFQTEFELIQSKKVLNRIIKRLDLQRKFSQMNGMTGDQLMTEDQTYVMLRRGMLAVQPYRNTKLIEIAVNSTDPALCKLIANTIADEYEVYRLEEIQIRSESGLSSLKNEMDKQKAEFDRAKAKVEKLRKELGPDSYIPGGMSNTNDVATMQDMELQRKEAMLSEMKSDVLARKVRLDKIKDLSPQEMESVIASLGLEDGTISQTKQNLYANETYLKSLEKQGFESEHPRIKSTLAQIKKLRNQLDDLLVGVKRSLEIDLGVSEAKVAGVEAEVLKLRDNSRSNRSEKLAPYEDAIREMETQSSLYSLLVARYKQESVDAQITSRPVTLVNAAEENLRPIRPNLTLNISLAALVGLVLGVSLAFFIEYLDTSVKSLDDVERYLNTTVVGVVPEGVSALNLEGPDSPNAEAYRILRAKIDLKAKPDGAHTLTVVSGGPGEGKTTTLFNLAYVCAYSGINTLIVDTDFRRHSLNSILGISNDQGLADFLLGYGPLHEYIRATEIPNLHVISAGKLPPQCMGALSPAKMSEVVETLKPHYDVILFDAPPILGISDAAVIVHEVDTTLLAIQHRRYPRNISWRAKKVVEEVGGRFGGVILNKVHLRSDDSYYYYTSYYGYYGYYKSGSRGEAKKKARENKRQLEKKVKKNQASAVEPPASGDSPPAPAPGGTVNEDF
ncbi:MAG: polysaccharide biosynthesis tyrosine autokinase [Candidatus Methylacidiphilales bacterium]|nr:polysaccharide biosynthesis tyrosine autokinase [Candidatus Methylacidiphilales bacterium]